MNNIQPIYEIERVNRVENTKSALAGFLVGGLLTAGALLLLAPSGPNHENTDQRSGWDRAPDNGHKQAAR
jgi:hypothetical protein